MVSNVITTIPVDGIPSVKSEFRANWTTIRDEISALQATGELRPDIYIASDANVIVNSPTTRSGVLFNQTLTLTANRNVDFAISAGWNRLYMVWHQAAGGFQVTPRYENPSSPGAFLAILDVPMAADTVAVFVIRADGFPETIYHGPQRADGMAARNATGAAALAAGDQFGRTVRLIDATAQDFTISQDGTGGVTYPIGSRVAVRNASATGVKRVVAGAGMTFAPASPITIAAQNDVLVVEKIAANSWEWAGNPAFAGDFNAAAAIDYVTPAVLSVSGLLNQAAHGGRPCHLSGNVTVPITNGFTCELVNPNATGGTSYQVGPASGSLIHQGVMLTAGTTISLTNLQSAVVRSDDTNVWVYGPAAEGAAAAARYLFQEFEFPEERTYSMVGYSPFAGTITTLRHFTISGTCTVALKIGGVTVTGLSAVAMSSTPGTATATANNVVSIGSRIEVTFTGIITGAPVRANLTLLFA